MAREHVARGLDMDESLAAQADAFAHLLAVSPDDPDGAFRRAAALAQGLFPHQIEGVAFLLGRHRAILADDMGLGKTRQAIVALRHIAPAGPYLDIVARVKAETRHPLAAYQVSGEYAMIRAAAERGWVDGDRAMMESLIGIRRAGADMIITYFAVDAAKRLRADGA